MPTFIGPQRGQAAKRLTGQIVADAPVRPQSDAPDVTASGQLHAVHRFFAIRQPPGQEMRGTA